MPGDALNALSMRRFANRGFPASVTLCGTWENLQLELFRIRLVVFHGSEREEKNQRRRELLRPVRRRQLELGVQLVHRLPGDRGRPNLLHLLLDATAVQAVA